MQVVGVFMTFKLEFMI